ncbi:MAG: DivIVA domain-containing protein [Mycobacteriaceae bacterium]|nr:DivIVA domain-containing protein [Mycobacteriaceae bacterium]
MSTTFPRARKSGYNVDQVEDFLEEARRAYTADPRQPVVLDAAAIRRTAFSLQRNGYSTNHVDAALERLEDAFAQRERERARSEAGDAAWYAQARSTAQVILDRLARPAGRRFNRVGPLTGGYSVKDVDAFTDRLVGYFQHGKPMSVEQVRTVVFRTAKRGYSETQVDMLLDAVIDVMLAVR